MQIVPYFTFLLFAAALFAQQGKPASVRGQVTSITGEPLRKADVTLRSTGQRPSVVVTTTDASGAFAFENVEPSKYVISAQRTGYVRQDTPRRSGGSAPGVQGLSVEAGQNVTGVVIKLTPHSIVTGKVTDEDGDPMFGSTVNILEERYFRGKRTLTARAMGQVNDLGEYRVAGLAPGKYFVAIQPRGDYGPSPRIARRQGEESDRSFVTVYYPGVVEPSQATAVAVGPGQEARGIDVQMSKVATVHIRGRLLDESGNPVNGAAVMVLNADGAAGNPGVGRHVGVARQGAFEIAGVPPGKHTLVANRMARDRGRSTARLEVQVGPRDLEGITMRMAPGAQVTGVVRAADNPNLANVRVTLDPIEGLSSDMHSSRNMGEGNTFTVADVAPGRYRVDIFGAPDGYYLKSVQVSGQDVLDSELAVESAVDGVEILLAKGAATVEGIVSDADGKPLGQSVVALVPPADKRDHWRLFKSAMTDQNGHYTFRNLTPGEYMLLAYGPASGDPSAVQDPEYLKQVESKGSVVKLAENARKSAPLKAVE